MRARHRQPSSSAIFTVGHSTHPIGELLEMLQAHQIEAVIDVRSIPMSRFNPQFNQEALSQSLRQKHIQYKHLKNLGGLRRAQKDSINLGWRNSSFRGFADYMATPEFNEGLETLIEIAKSKTGAIMCAEAVPWRCHRSLIADALIKKGWKVLNIMSRTIAKPHALTPFLKVKSGRLIYPKA